MQPTTNSIKNGHTSAKKDVDIVPTRVNTKIDLKGGNSFKGHTSNMISLYSKWT